MTLQKVLSRVRQAVDDYHMIEEGDRIAVGISGGKDSLTLLLALNELSKFYPKHFTLIAVTVDLGFDNLNLDEIRTLCADRNIPYTVVETSIAQIVFEDRKEDNPCSLCAKMRKGALNDAIKAAGCNKIAYAHHEDDVVETMMLSLFYEGRLHTFSPVTHPVPPTDIPGGNMSKSCLGSLTEKIQVSRIVYLRQFKKEIWKDGQITLAVIKEENYHDEQNKNNILKLRKVLDTLPPFCRDFFRGIEPYTSTRTRLAYAYDIRLFFEFLHETNSYCKKREITELPLSVLDMVQRTDIEEYLDYMSLYQKDGKDITNDERGKARKLAALRSFYNYYFQSERIEKNTAALVPLPKRHEKEIIRLEPNEVAILLDQVEDGTKLTKKELEYHKKTKLRDVALLTLLLGTGIRVSECVGLDINDVDFDNGGIKIRRKGGYEAIVYFGEEVETALLDYLEQREHIIPAEGHENALFLSLQNRRMAVRSVENLVKKYASRVTTLKKITPHKLRSTYGTELYKETRDIYLVADVLGHKDVNTTRKHYAALEEQRRRQAANAFHLREHSNRHSDQPDS